MRILLVSNSLQGGGAERVMAVVASYLARRHAVRLLAVHGDEAEYAVSDAVEVLFASGAHYNWSSIVDWIASQIDDFAPDITMSFLHGINDMAIAARYRAHHDAPIVISERVDPTWATQAHLLIGRERLYPLADGGIFQTPQIEAYYREHHAMRNTTVLVNPLSPGFDLEPFPGERDKRIVAVGRLAPEKNHAVLVRAFALIAGEFPGHTLEVYGEGELHDALQNQIDRAGLSERILLKGRVTDVPGCIADASLFVHSSLHEGMPNAVLEAMALGLPCVVTDTPYGGTAALVDPGINALIVPPDDEYALAEGMRALLADDALRSRISAEAPKVLDRYRACDICPRWEAYLEETVAAYERPRDIGELRKQARAGFIASCSYDPLTLLKQSLSREQYLKLRTLRRMMRESSKVASIVGRAAKRACKLTLEGISEPGRTGSPERLKVAFVIYNLAGGGAERVMSVLARHLAERHDVSIVTCVDDERDYEVGPDVHIVCEFDPSYPEGIKRLASIYHGLAKVDPDIAVGFLSGWNVRAVISKLALGSRFKVVVSERNCPYHKFDDVWDRGITKIAYLLADGGAFQTGDALAYWKRWCRRNPAVLVNPLNEEIRTHGLQRAVRPAKPREPRIVNAGRLVPQKNQAQLIAAFGRIADEFPTHTLEIYGEGELRGELEALVDELGLGGRVKLMGRVPSDEIAGRIEDAALFAFPSLWEGLPNALLEAMALGMPCIASDCTIGGSRDLIDDGESGLLVPVGDEDALVDAMRRLLADPEYAERLGRQALRSAQRYEANRVCREWEEYLLKIAGR